MVLSKSCSRSEEITWPTQRNATQPSQIFTFDNRCVCTRPLLNSHYPRPSASCISIVDRFFYSPEQYAAKSEWQAGARAAFHSFFSFFFFFFFFLSLASFQPWTNSRNFIAINKKLTKLRRLARSETEVLAPPRLRGNIIGELVFQQPLPFISRSWPWFCRVADAVATTFND